MSERVKRWNLDKWEWHKAKHDDGRNNGSVVTRGGICICKAPQYETEGQWIYHAQLLRSAPALVEALEVAIEDLKSWNITYGNVETQKVIEACEEELSRAYGETQ